MPLYYGKVRMKVPAVTQAKLAKDRKLEASTATLSSKAAPFWAAFQTHPKLSYCC